MNITLKRAARNAVCMGGRTGTCTASRAELIEKLGSPSYTGSPDDKVTIAWVFNTPRGRAEIRDYYWWNRPDEWSIAAENRKAHLWMAAHLRTLGFHAGAMK